MSTPGSDEGVWETENIKQHKRNYRMMFLQGHAKKKGRSIIGFPDFFQKVLC